MSLELERWSLLKKHLYKIYPYKCMKCKKTNCEIHADHVLPKSKHSNCKYKLDNLQVLCKNCNYEKSNKNKIDYRTKTQLRKMAQYIHGNIDYLTENKLIASNMITKNVLKELVKINRKYKKKNTSIAKTKKYVKNKSEKEVTKRTNTCFNISTSKNKDGSTKTLLIKKALLG